MIWAKEVSKIKKQLVISAIVITITGATLFVPQASAEEKTNGMDTLIQKISDTFHLNKTDVQKVFDEHRAEHIAKREGKFEDRLSQAVKDGKLTEEQKTLILNKMKELASESFKNMTPEERRSAMQKKHQELENFAKQNNIDSKWLMPGFGMRGRFVLKNK